MCNDIGMETIGSGEKLATIDSFHGSEELVVSACAMSDCSNPEVYIANYAGGS